MVFKITKKKGLGRNFHTKEILMKPTPKVIELSVFDKCSKGTSSIFMELDLLDIIRLKAFLEVYCEMRREENE